MTELQMRQALRQAVRGLWSGVLDSEQFRDAMTSLVDRQLKKAWQEGALQCGIREEEISKQELDTRDTFIAHQFSFIAGFSSAIISNSKANKGKIAPLYVRADYWVDRYPEAKANAKALACADQKAEFQLGPTKAHCRSCLGLNGRVYRYSVWIANGAVPPHNWNFECRGGCRCQLVTTDKPITPGKFPRGLLA